MEHGQYITSNQDILSGTPVFRGSRVPFSYLMHYIERGLTIEQFVQDYPSVDLALVSKALEEASHLVEEAVYARPS